jgi:hypothetical protein
MNKVDNLKVFKVVISAADGKYDRWVSRVSHMHIYPE